MNLASTLIPLLALASQPVSLLGPNPQGSLSQLGEMQYGKVTEVAVQGQPFAQAKQAETLTRPPLDYNFQLGSFTTEPVERGDVVHITFFARAIKGQPETGEGRAQVNFVTSGPEWAASFRQVLSIPRTWKKYELPFTVLYTRAAGQSLVAFSLGFNPQVIEVADFKILNYKKSVKVNDLPRTRSDYPGQEIDAPWRKEAEARIEKLRKGEMTVRVVDARNRPVPGALVAINQVKHEFLFGTGAASDRLFKQDPDSERYRQTLKKYFNQVAIENHLKWPFWEDWARIDGLRSLVWLREQGFNVRAHNIIWPGYSNLPPDLPQYAKEPDLLRKRIASRVADITTATKGYVDDWDVVNESYSNNDLIKILGEREIATWFELTKKADPKPRLTLNDYPALDSEGLKTDPHLKYFYDLIGKLQGWKAPVEAIGFQCHFGSAVVPPERVLKGLDAFSKFKLPILITEFDMDTTDRDLQARYMRDFLTATFSHPSVEGVTQWGFWEGQHWMPNAALWAQDWTIHPHGQVYLDLVYGKWWTKADVTSNRQGIVRTRAFYGDYEATVKVGTEETKARLKFSKGTGVLTVKLAR